jgi:hypothetical protein
MAGVLLENELQYSVVPPAARTGDQTMEIISSSLPQDVHRAPRDIHR